jgi:hypothetical protein
MKGNFNNSGVFEVILSDLGKGEMGHTWIIYFFVSA